MPVLISFITIPLVSAELSSAFNVAVIFIALLIGLLIGFLIGKFMEVEIDENGSMILKGSYIAVFMWIAIILLKIYGENVLSGTGWIELNLITSAALIMTLGAMISRRSFVYWKYLKFKKEHTLKAGES
jgi:ABC-type multidrug transport system permease subunit